MNAGSYCVDWWDTATGVVLKHLVVVYADNTAGLQLAIPEIKTDMAVRIYPVISRKR
jgi:hypothetical protein